MKSDQDSIAQINELFHPRSVAIIGCGLTPEDSQTFVRYMIEVQQECRKPLLMVAIPGHDLNLGEQFCQAGIPFFESAERAMRTYACVFRYQSWRQKKAALR